MQGRRRKDGYRGEPSFQSGGQVFLTCSHHPAFGTYSMSEYQQHLLTHIIKET